MEKVSLYLKKLLALAFSSAIYSSLVVYLQPDLLIGFIVIGWAAFLLFAYLDFKITGEKPRFLFGMNNSDTFLNKKGGFWNLFKWIVNSLGFLYDLIVWAIWGVYLLFVLFVDYIMLLKTIVFWIIYAVIWFIRQLFPPFIFIFKMVMHYMVNWSWWIYQLAFRNMKVSVNNTFYFIALWGAIPALFIVFLFYAISQIAGIPELTAISAVFALIPLVWSFAEISTLRIEQREKEGYFTARYQFRNGFEAVKSVLFYLGLIIGLIVIEIVLNMVGWIPNLSMSLFGISLNLNMAISLVLVFLAVIIAFAGSILPTHIVYTPLNENEFGSHLAFLQVIGKKFLRYLFVWPSATLFGGFLLVIPIVVMLLAYTVTDSLKDVVLGVRIEKLQEKAAEKHALEAYPFEKQIEVVKMYQNVPLLAPVYFEKTIGATGRIRNLETEIENAKEQLEERKLEYNQDIREISARLEGVRSEGESSSVFNEVNQLTSRRLDLEETFLAWEKNQQECIAFMNFDLKGEKRVRAQMPVLYLFAGIFFAIFGGLVFAVFVAYIGNVFFELYAFREDDKPTKWCQTVAEIKEKDSNQPLLGFTLLVIIAVLVVIGYLVL